MSDCRALTKTGRRVLEYLALLCVLAVIILLVVHPWAKFFGNGLPAHWDPPSHASHLSWNAHNILQGHLLRPHYHENFFYPHAYTLAFDEPMWPPSFFAALIYGLTGDPLIVWNATALFIWALSGVTMYAFLRELPVSRGVGYLGAAIFCLMPYRLAYYVEFNMICCFGIPLSYLFLVRWLRRLRRVDALLFALVYCISASTCLYYTVIMTVPMPFVLAGFLVRRPEMLRQRRLYLTGALALAIAGGLCFAMLYPYLMLRCNAHYVRTLAQQARSSIQPLSYLRPSKASLIHRFAAKANLGETIVFPGLTLCALACLYWFKQRFVFRPRRHVPLKVHVQQGLAYARAVLWFVFAVLVVYGAYHTNTSSFAGMKAFVLPTIHLIFWTSLVLLFLPADREIMSARALLSGLGVGAIACFILSFGPTVTLGHGRDIIEVGKGAETRFYSLLPFFSLTRVMTRFSIIVLFFMITGGCVAFDALLSKSRRLRWLWLVPVLLVVVETYSRPYRFEPQRPRLTSAVQHHLQALPQKVSVVQIPYGERRFDAPAMLCTVGKWDYLINGWGGFMPEQHHELGIYLSSHQMFEAAEWLRAIWPEAYLIVDLEAVRSWKICTGNPFKEKHLKPYWTEVMRDDLFALYRLKPLDETPPCVLRRLRTDVLRRHPRLVFDARAIEIPEGATASVRIRVNDESLTTLALTAGPQKLEVEIPRRMTGNIFGEEVSLTLEHTYPNHTEEPEDTGLWEVRNLDFLTK